MRALLKVHARTLGFALPAIKLNAAAHSCFAVIFEGRKPINHGLVTETRARREFRECRHKCQSGRGRKYAERQAAKAQKKLERERAKKLKQLQRLEKKAQKRKDRRVEIVPVGQEKKVEAPVEEKPAAPAAPVARPQKAAKAPEGRVTETVKAGSRLAQIARRHYGNPDYWIYIYEANRDKLSKPSELPVGIELVIPSIEEIQQQEANK